MNSFIDYNRYDKQLWFEEALISQNYRMKFKFILIVGPQYLSIWIIKFIGLENWRWQFWI